MNLKHAYSLFVISIHLFLEERNSVVKVGVEFIISMMEILQFVRMSYLTI